MSPVTLKSIAKATGYSITTVSRALGGHTDVNEETRRRILQVAQEMGYQPNLVARQLRSQRTYTIGLISPSYMYSHEDDFFALLIKGIGRAAARHQYDLLLSSHLHGDDEMDAYRRIVGGNRVDGVIVARTYRDDPRIAYLKSLNHPFVVSGRNAPGLPNDFPFIDADSQLGIHMMVSHIVSQGYREIGLILPPDDLAFTGYRLAGYRDGLAEAGIDYHDEYVIYGDLTLESGYQAAKTLLARAPQLTAIIAANDLMALGAMRAVQEQGFHVGHDFAIGGFDNIPAGQHTSPSLTTVSQPIIEIGERLAEMLFQIIEGETPADNGLLIEPTLVIRASTNHAHNQP